MPKYELVLLNAKNLFDCDAEFVLYHEMIHHLIGKLNKIRKNLYLRNGYRYGEMLEEGFVNFLTELFLQRRGFGPYAFSTYVVRQFSNILGIKEMVRIALGICVQVVTLVRT